MGENDRGIFSGMLAIGSGKTGEELAGKAWRCEACGNMYQKMELSECPNCDTPRDDQDVLMEEMKRLYPKEPGRITAIKLGDDVTLLYNLFPGDERILLVHGNVEIEQIEYGHPNRQD